MPNWSDYQIIVAIREAQTLSGAARRLELNQSTISRILKRIETNLKEPLFSRASGVYELTPEGEPYFRVGKEMERAISEFAHSRSSSSTQGTVRLTSVEALVKYLLIRLATFRERFPNIAVELNGSNQNVNLSQRQFHAALRLHREENSKSLLTKKVGEIGISGYRKRVGSASSEWIGYESTLASIPEEKWLRIQTKKRKPLLYVSSYVTMETAIEQGFGVGLLPRFIGDQNAALQRMTGEQPVLSRPLWFISHPEYRRDPAMEIFSKWLFQQISDDKSLLGGLG